MRPKKDDRNILRRLLDIYGCKYIQGMLIRKKVVVVGGHLNGHIGKINNNYKQVHEGLG